LGVARLSNRFSGVYDDFARLRFVIGVVLLGGALLGIALGAGLAWTIWQVCTISCWERWNRGCSFPQGMGLSIAQMFVTAHGDRLEVDSIPSTGSHFVICLPM
jgi:hypothetical protein